METDTGSLLGEEEEGVAATLLVHTLVSASREVYSYSSSGRKLFEEESVKQKTSQTSTSTPKIPVPFRLPVPVGVRTQSSPVYE